MPTIISNQAVDFIDHEIVVKPLTDPDGTEHKVTEYRIRERVHVVAGVQQHVPDWVLESDHFKSLVADGKASSGDEIQKFNVINRNPWQ
jgi:hypothetical protein